MPSPLKGVLGSRVMPVTLPHTSLNPITHLNLLALSLEIASVAKHSEPVRSASQDYSISSHIMGLGCKPRRLSLQAAQTGLHPGYGDPNWTGGLLAPAPDGVGGSGGGVGGGTGGGLVTTPGFEEPTPEQPGGIITDGEEVSPDSEVIQPSVPGGGMYMVPGGSQGLIPGAEPWTPGGGGFGDIVQPDAPAFPTQPSTPGLTQLTVTVVDSIAGSVFYQIANRGRMPLPATVEVLGRYGDLELFHTPPVVRTFPPNLQPVKYKSDFIVEANDAQWFWEAIGDESGPAGKATLVLDCLIKWKVFSHKVSDARQVAVSGLENL